MKQKSIGKKDDKQIVSQRIQTKLKDEGIIKIPEEHPKGWGKELWIANTDLYCGKKLILLKGKKCSIHYHKIKHETFYIQSGKIRMDLYPDNIKGWLGLTSLEGYSQDYLNQLLGKRKRLIMKPGDILPIPPGLPHRFYGLEDSEFFEFSTQHFEEDSHRIERGD